jgi:hypothetical protein
MLDLGDLLLLQKDFHDIESPDCSRGIDPTQVGLRCP